MFKSLFKQRGDGGVGVFVCCLFWMCVGSLPPAWPTPALKSGSLAADPGDEMLVTTRCAGSQIGPK